MTEAREITQDQDLDFVWTWKSNSRSAKVSLWLPYFSDAKKIPRTKKWHVAYNGGALLVDLDRVDFIMFYGASGNLSLEFLDALAQHRIPLMIHRRNQRHPYVFHPSVIGDDVDILSKQILIRGHDQKRAYVARTLIRERLAKFSPIFDVSPIYLKRLSAARAVSDIRVIEADMTAKYWKRWFSEQGAVEESRRGGGVIAAALDAGSAFLFGVLLRWVLFHKLSPCHGFLHEPTSYPSLIYDLMEPYRYLVEDSVAMAMRSLKSEEIDAKKLTARTLANLKETLEEVVYVPATRQYVRRKNLLHGVVLALRAYLLNESLRLVIPTEGVKNGGRPPKVGYRLPGETKKKELGAY